MTASTSTATTGRCAPSPLQLTSLPAIAAGVGWTWSAVLLATRHHLVLFYDVLPTTVPAWGFLGLPWPRLVLAVCAGAALAGGCLVAARAHRRAFSKPVGWLLSALVIPGIDLLRLAGAAIPYTFLEPLWLAFATGVAVEQIVAALPIAAPVRRLAARAPAHLLVWLLAFAAGAWWYHQGQQAYANYLLGYHDFGHFARRVANTWEGRGFLRETPSLPAFWDHFNPGLALLVPLWGLWPNAKLFILLQAACLALPAPLAYGIARRAGAEPLSGLMWAAAYLVFPAVGQLNLNYSYGWHPVSLALPLIFWALWALLRRCWLLAALVSLLACSFKENVPLVLGCVAGVIAVLSWTDRYRGRAGGRRWTTSLLPAQLPCWTWLAVGAVFAVLFLLIYKLAGFSQFQASRFAHLGRSVPGVILSPVLRPAVFWGTVLRPQSLFFVLCLLVPLGFRTLLRGWPMALTVVLPVGVLVAWGYPAATSIAFQYTTTLVPFLFVASLSGVPFAEVAAPSQEEVGRGRQGLRARSCSAGVLAAGVTASAFFGALPWSTPTLTVMREITYASQSEGAPPRGVGSMGNRTINSVVARVSDANRSVLASGRIAAHLLRVRRLETAVQARSRWQALEAEAGPGRSAIEVFDWIILDVYETFQQSDEDVQFLIAEAGRAGYKLVQSDLGIFVFQRPGEGSALGIRPASRRVPGSTRRSRESVDEKKANDGERQEK